MTHIFFGGTFDPPHEGHRLVLERVLKAFPKAQIVVVPGAAPAGAYGQHKSPKAPYADRIAMCKLTLSDLIERHKVEVSEIEGSLEAPNFTWKTLKALTLTHPGSRWALLVGYDQLQNFGGWQRAADIVRNYDLVSIERPGFDPLETILEKLRSSFGTLQDEGHDVYRFDGSPQRLYILKGAVSAAESRVAREAMTLGSFDKEWLAPSVKDYIKHHQLYAGSEDT